MAEILVLKNENWMHYLTQAQIDAKVAENPKFIYKYNSRQRRGDIVQIEDDGHFTGQGRGYDTEHFDLVLIPNRTKAQVRVIAQGPLVIDGELKKKFRACLTSWTDGETINANNIVVKTS